MMKKRLRFLLPFLLGAAYGLALTLLTSRLITGAWRLAAPVAKLLRLEEVQEVALALKEQYEVTVDKRKISMDDIKAFGSYPAEIKLPAGVVAKVTVAVSEA